MVKCKRRNRNVKIVATLGPASSTELMVSKLFEEGVDVFRLNLSHGLHSEIKKRHEIIRRVEKKFGRPICILADLQGPKLRCGEFKNKEAELVPGQSFIFDKDFFVTKLFVFEYFLKISYLLFSKNFENNF